MRIAHPQIASDAKKFFASDVKTHSLDLKSQENARKKDCENPAMLACDAKNHGVFLDRAMRNACDSDSRCGLACDASARDVKSLAIRVERCEPLSPRLSGPRSSFGGVQNFSGGCVLWYVFLPPYVLHPPIPWPTARLF